MSAINKKSNITIIYGCKTGNNEFGQSPQACENYNTLYKHDVTKIRQNGVINFIVSNSTVVF